MKFKIGLPLTAATVAGVVALAGANPAYACGEEPYIGQICFFAGTYCPYGMTPLDGRQMQVNSNQPLFALIGTTYGGNYSQGVFNLPSTLARAIVGAGSNSAVNPFGYSQAVGKTAGSETAVLNMSTMAAHNHAASYVPGGGTTPLSLQATISASTSNGTDKAPVAGDYLAVTVNGATQYPHYAPSTVSGTKVQLGSAASSVTGSGTPVLAAAGVTSPQSFSIIQPQLGVTACIVSSLGNWPVRPDN